jgi:hypothetical protein
MSKRTFIGTCSNCREHAGVIRARGVQLCGVCISKLTVPAVKRTFEKIAQ